MTCLFCKGDIFAKLAKVCVDMACDYWHILREPWTWNVILNIIFTPPHSHQEKILWRTVSLKWGNCVHKPSCFCLMNAVLFACEIWCCLADLFMPLIIVLSLSLSYKFNCDGTVVVWNYRFVHVGEGDPLQGLMMCTDVLAASETTPASICVQRDLSLYTSGGDKIFPLDPCCVFDLL